MQDGNIFQASFNRDILLKDLKNSIERELTDIEMEIILKSTEYKWIRDDGSVSYCFPAITVLDMQQLREVYNNINQTTCITKTKKF